MKIIALAHDPGGANAVAATVAALQTKEKDTKVEAYAKGPAIRQFQRLAVSCIAVSEEHQTLFSELTGDILLTGTSQYDDFERDGIVWAKKKGIPSIAVLDYWANYRLRFQFSGDPDAEPIFPDTIAAIDEICMEGMLADGLPMNRIHIVGQPYFSWLLAKHQRIKNNVKPPQYILFASQPRANEVEILRILIKVLSEYQSLKKLLIRFHPRQGKCRVSLELLEKSGLPFAVDESTDILTTLKQQDIVLGITSMILIEAALMGIPAGSLVMGVQDTLITNKYGLTIPLTSPDKLWNFLNFEQKVELEQQFVEQQRDANLQLAELCKTII